ncbi:MAG: hypothetical protein ACOZB3_03050 [Calditrichota bacterium]
MKEITIHQPGHALMNSLFTSFVPATVIRIMDNVVTVTPLGVNYDLMGGGKVPS